METEWQAYRKTSHVWARQNPDPFVVETEEGTMRGRPGDYLCEGVLGERWPVKKEIFEATYERCKEGDWKPPHEPTDYSEAKPPEPCPDSPTKLHEYVCRYCGKER